MSSPHGQALGPQKRVAILVIASTRSPLYVHYLETYWSSVIRWTNAVYPHISVFLLFEHDVELDRFGGLENHIIQDPTSDYDRHCDPARQTPGIPGILLKTIFALDLLQDRYDVFFRTNLSSMLKLSAFDRFVQEKNDLRYSSAFVWVDALRQQLEQTGQVGPNKRLKTLDELRSYTGNSFASGSGYFLNRSEAKSLLERRDRIRFDLADDISVGLMFRECELLPRFSFIGRRDRTVAELSAGILEHPAVHIRLQHLELTTAKSLWDDLGDHEMWR
ncbi:MAG: hypothetical protein AAGM22_27290 [Acidobacteriota bacterium]